MKRLPCIISNFIGNLSGRIQERAVRADKSGSPELVQNIAAGGE